MVDYYCLTPPQVVAAQVQLFRSVVLRKVLYLGSK